MRIAIKVGLAVGAVGFAWFASSPPPAEPVDAAPTRWGPPPFRTAPPSRHGPRIDADVRVGMPRGWVHGIVGRPPGYYLGGREHPLGSPGWGYDAWYADAGTLVVHFDATERVDSVAVFDPAGNPRRRFEAD